MYYSKVNKSYNKSKPITQSQNSIKSNNHQYEHRREDNKVQTSSQATRPRQNFSEPPQFPHGFSHGKNRREQSTESSKYYSKPKGGMETTKIYGAPQSIFSYYKLPTVNPTTWVDILGIMQDLQRPKPSIEAVLKTIHTLAEFTTRAKRVDVSLLKHYLLNNPKFLQDVIPFIAELVKSTPKLFPDPKQIQILTQGRYGRVTLSRHQCACLLANMFMCTTINQGNAKLQRDFNFSTLYEATRDPKKDHVKIQKIACIFNYFKKVSQHLSTTESVIFARCVLEERIHGRWEPIDWKLCDAPVLKPKVELGKIEEARNALEVDFANKYLGGGVLRGGSVQEEIQFITRPEQIVGMLFCECLNSTEAIRIKGAKIYSDYSGYTDSFTFQPGGSYGVDKTCAREVVAIDATDFSSMPASHQYGENSFLRDLNKAYVGFWGDFKDKGKEISTGAWGCGVFGGNLELKFIIQLAAASRAGRRMIFNSQGIHKSMNLPQILSYYTTKTVRELIGDTLSCLEQYRKSPGKKMELFKDLASLKMTKSGYNRR